MAGATRGKTPGVEETAAVTQSHCDMVLLLEHSRKL